MVLRRSPSSRVIQTITRGRPAGARRLALVPARGRSATRDRASVVTVDGEPAAWSNKGTVPPEGARARLVKVAVACAGADPGSGGNGRAGRRPELDDHKGGRQPRGMGGERGGGGDPLVPLWRGVATEGAWRRSVRRPAASSRTADRGYRARRPCRAWGRGDLGQGPPVAADASPLIGHDRRDDTRCRPPAPSSRAPDL